MARFGFLALPQSGGAVSDMAQGNIVGQTMPPTSLGAMRNAAGNQSAVGTQPAHEPYTALDNPSLTPSEIQDQEFAKNSADVFGNDGTRTSQTPLAPGPWQEHRIMEANRAAPGDNFIPGAYYENQDPQKGGAPGAAGGADGYPASTNFITSQGPDGITTPGGVPPSPRKLAYGWSDWWGHTPTFVGSHLKIQWNANPNKPQLNPTPFNLEGPSQNTRYTTPSPFAAGTFIGS